MKNRLPSITAALTSARRMLKWKYPPPPPPPPSPPKGKRLQYAKTVGRVPIKQRKQLTPGYQRIMRRKPDIARAQEIFGYDSDLGQLFYKDEYGGIGEYTELGAMFTPMDDKLYATWKLKSAVLLGTINALTRRRE